MPLVPRADGGVEIMCIYLSSEGGWGVQVSTVTESSPDYTLSGPAPDIFQLRLVFLVFLPAQWIRASAHDDAITESDDLANAITAKCYVNKFMLTIGKVSQ